MLTISFPPVNQESNPIWTKATADKAPGFLLMRVSFRHLLVSENGGPGIFG